MGFGKIKRVFGKKGKNSDGDEKEVNATPNSTPTRNANVLQASLNPAGREKDNVPLLSDSHTGADDVLDGILQDLNIKVGQLAVDAEKTDTVSEYSGGSAKSIESSECTSDDDEEDEETDEEDEETEEDNAEGQKAYNKKHSSVDDRVAAVLGAAEEIKRKKKSESSSKASPETEDAEGRSASPATEPHANDEAREGTSGSRAASREASKSQESSQQSPAKQKSDRAKGRSSSNARSGDNAPQFSPAIKSGGVRNDKSFDTRGDCDQTKETMEVSDEDDRTFESRSKGEDETLDEDRTVDTEGYSYEEGNARSLSESQNGESTFDEEDRDIKTKKTVMNKDVIIHQPGGASSLVVRAMYYTPLPASPDDIIIKVEASTVSFRDCLLRRDIGVDKVSFPFVPGCEVVGRISNIGKAARQEGYRVGDRVVGITRQGGGNGYYAKFPARKVAPIMSSSIDAADAVCLVDVYMTAYQALRVGKRDGTPLTDANVLVTDGFSPVGQAAVQLAKLEGANVYVTTTESRQDDYMKTLGVKCLPLAPSKWLHKLKGKMDIVIDNTCFDSYDSSWKALNSKGILVCTGTTSIYGFQDFGMNAQGCGCDALGDMRDYQAKWAALKARYMMSQTKFHDLVESFQSNPKKYQQELKYLCFLVESGMLKPKIAERVSIEEIPDAQRYLETGKANGTIVCLP